MEKNLEQLFKQETDSEAPYGLSDRIFVRIEKEAASYEHTQKYLWGTFSILSICAFVASSWYAFATFSASSFGSYFSLIFSDGGSIALWWRELGLSLIESLPIAGVALFLASVCAVLWCIRKFATYNDRHFITDPGVIIA